MTNTFPQSKLLEAIGPHQFQTVTFRKSQVIHFEGEHCDHLEIIIQGKLIVERIGEDGHLLVIREFASGDILGVNLIFSKSPYYPMTITALTDISLVRIGKNAVFDLCATNDAFLQLYLELISDYAVVLGDRIKNHVNRPLKKRILTYLENESLRQQTCKIQLQTSKKALAEYFGVERTSLSRALQQLKQDGLIDYDAKNITILKR